MLRDIEHNARIEADHIVGDLLNRRSGGYASHSDQSPLSIAYSHLKAYEIRRARILDVP